MELLTINGWVRTVYRPEDFETLIREHMGDDAADYFRRFYVQQGRGLLPGLFFVHILH